MDEEFSIRKLRTRDLKHIRKIMVEGKVFSRTDKKDLYKSIENYHKKRDEEELVTYVASLDGRVVGFVSYGKELGEGTYEIFIISVDKKYQGRGIGTRLVRFAEKNIRQKKARVIYISTSSTKAYLPARKLYLGAGYRKAATVKDYFTDGDSMIIFSKRIRKPHVSPH